MSEVKQLRRTLQRIKNDDEHAFRQLFRKFSSTVYSFSLKLTRSESQAEEIVQEVFLKLWVRRDTLTAIDNFGAYLFTMTRHLALNVLKHKAIEARAKALLAEATPAGHCETEDIVVYRDYEQLLDKAVRHLPPQQQTVYRLCRHEGLQYEEVARRLKISRLTVKTHMQQALRTIRSQFTGIVRISIIFLPMLILQGLIS